MTIDLLREILGWCTIINYGVLLVGFFVLMAAHDTIHRLHGRWFKLTSVQFDAMHYGVMAVYKVLILVFNLVRFVALHIAA